MPTTTLTVLPTDTYDAGTFSFGPVTPPTGVVTVTVAADRTLWTDPSLQINWSIELSTDNGNTFLPWGGAGTVGGIVIDPETGLPSPESSFTISFPAASTPAYRLRGQITFNKTLTTTVTVNLVS